MDDQVKASSLDAGGAGGQDTESEQRLELEVLRRRIRDLEADVRARDDFISTLGHELRNPLSPIFLQTQHLLDQVRSAKDGVVSSQWLAPRLETFMQRLKRMLTTLDRLLDASSLRAGRLVLSPERVDLAAAAREACACLEREAALAGTPVTVVGDPEVIGHWDPVRLDQIIGNLLSNAIRYGAGQPIEVRVEGDGASARLSVQDHGVGIASADQPRIFERFERGTAEHTSGGFGLGLWVVWHLCAAMGGRVEVHSERGAGATFTVTLPREESILQ